MCIQGIQSIVKRKYDPIAYDWVYIFNRRPMHDNFINLGGYKQDFIGDHNIPCKDRNDIYCFLVEHFDEIKPVHAYNIYLEVILTQRRIWSLPQKYIDRVYEKFPPDNVNILIELIWKL